MIQITKGKVLKDDIVEVTFLRISATSKPAKCNEEHKDPPHPDLRRAMATFAIHAAILAEFISADEISNIDEPSHRDLANFHVSGFSTKGDDDDDSVVITGQKTLRSGKVLIFNTPSIKLSDASENAYVFADDLKACLENAKYEFREYLNGKHAEDPQGKLDFDGPVTSVQIAKPVEGEFDPEKLEKPSVEATTRKNKKAVIEE